MADTKVSAETLVTAIAAAYKMYVVCDTGAAPDSNAATFAQVQNFIRTAFGTANDTGAGFIERASRAEMETGTDTGTAVVPGRLRFHPSALQCHSIHNGTGTPAFIANNANFNAASITDASAGVWNINFTNALDTGNIHVVGCGNGSDAFLFFTRGDSSAASFAYVATMNSLFSPTDSTYVHSMMHGDHP